jgi:iron(III) transport system substrate-binding protein
MAPSGMRRWCCASVVSMALVLLACGSEVADEGPLPDNQPDAGRIVVYSTIGEAILKPVFDRYTAETGIKVLVVPGKYPVLAEKIHRPGPGPVADLFVAGNAAELWQASDMGIFRPTRSEVLTDRVAARLRDPDYYWYSIATEVRTVVFNTNLAASPELASIADYGSLGDNRWRQRLCLSTSQVAGNRSLLAMLVNDHGTRDAEILVRGWRANLAATVYRDETRLLEAIAGGECVIGIAGSSELARYLQDHPDASVAPHRFPGSAVVHVDASGAGVTRHAQNPGLAASLLEWLTSDSANALFAARTLQYPVNSRSAADNSIAAWPEFDRNPVNLASLRFQNEDAVKVAERARYP